MSFLRKANEALNKEVERKGNGKPNGSNGSSGKTQLDVDGLLAAHEHALASAYDQAVEIPALAMVMRNDQLALHRRVSLLEKRLENLEQGTSGASNGTV